MREAGRSYGCVGKRKKRHKHENWKDQRNTEEKESKGQGYNGCERVREAWEKDLAVWEREKKETHMETGRIKC